MKYIFEYFRPIIIKSISFLYKRKEINIELQSTKKEYSGHITLLIFPLINNFKKPLKQIGQDIGEYVKKHLTIVQSFSLLKGFLNFEFNEEFYYKLLKKVSKDFLFKISEKKSLMIEYSSPNSNKPLHLGHIRNNILGDSLSKIFKSIGDNVIELQIINDRGIHICKSILGRKKFSYGENPKNSSKGDHLLGKYYVAFEISYKDEITYFYKKGYKKEYLKDKVPIIKEAGTLLFIWEKINMNSWDFWNEMNSWGYEGYKHTYYSLGINFNQTQFESKTFFLGKKIINNGFNKGIFLKKKNGSIWIDLTNLGVNDKLLLRFDGTSIYITQDIASSVERFELFSIKSLIYIVGEEQEYHFKILFLILRILGFKWINNLFHHSYGMIYLSSGKMRSREGSIIDADYLINELHKLIQFITYQKKKEKISITLGALKYYLLKIDTKRCIYFDFKTSIDINSNTGTYIQYTYVRIRALIFKSLNFLKEKYIWKYNMLQYSIVGRYEKSLLKMMEKFPKTFSFSKNYLSPAIIANLSFKLSKNFNDFYQNVYLLKTKFELEFIFRLLLSKESGKILKDSMYVLGIHMPIYM